MSESNTLESLFKLMHMAKRHMLKQIESLDLGVPPTHVRLIKIIGKNKACTANDIVQFLDRDKAQVTRVLNSLIEQELIMKLPNPQDKRSQHLRLTPCGEAIYYKIQQMDKELIGKMVGGLSEHEQQQFQQSVHKMSANFARSMTDK